MNNVVSKKIESLVALFWVYAVRFFLRPELLFLLSALKPSSDSVLSDRRSSPDHLLFTHLLLINYLGPILQLRHLHLVVIRGATTVRKSCLLVHEEIVEVIVDVFVVLHRCRSHLSILPRQQLRIRLRLRLWSHGHAGCLLGVGAKASIGPTTWVTL